MASAVSSASFFSISARSTLTVSLTSWKVTSVAPSGSGMVVMSIIMPSRRSMRATIGSRSSIAVTAARRFRQTVLSSCMRLRPGGHRLDVRMLVERLGRELPHALERRIVQPHAAVLPNTATASAR